MLAARSLAFLLLVSSAADAAEVAVAPSEVRIDGDLREWGGAQRVPVVPGGDLVGLRGVFAGLDDHEADVYALWDARHLYVAAAVTDDSLDVGVVEPSEREWRGAAGELKDRMFYYDHFKLFVRRSEALLGFTVWTAPGTTEGGPRAWGGKQRFPQTTEIPVQIGSVAHSPVVTYELAVPWTWLEIDPRPGLSLDAMFLFADSDQAGAPMGTKVRGGEAKWIWWQGDLTLTGEPPGLKPPPTAAAEPRALDEEATARELAGLRLQRAIAKVAARKKQSERAEEARTEVAESPAATGTGEGPGTGGDRQSSAAGTGQGPGAGDSSGAAASAAAVASGGPPAAGRPQSGGDAGDRTRQRTASQSLRDLLGRSLAARASGTPDWIREAGEEEGFTKAETDSLAATLARSLTRLAQFRISSRTDAIVIDMARAAQTGRGRAREFLMSLLLRIGEEIERAEGEVGIKLASAAQAAGLSETASGALVGAIARRGLSAYEEGEVTTTGVLVERAAREVDMSRANAERLIRILLAVDAL